MRLESITIKNFTVFDNEKIDFCRGLNVLVGPNGVGKTHLMKALYAACQAADPKTSFSNKIVKCFLPDDYRIARLVKKQLGVHNSSLKALRYDDNMNKPIAITLSFNGKTNKWDADVKGEKAWEQQGGSLISAFIPAKEILSNSYNLAAAVEKNNVSFDDTYIDIINSAKVDISLGRNAGEKNNILQRIEKIIGGKVKYDAKKDEFYLVRGGKKYEFNLVAEGIRKVALLWQLVKNGTMEKGSVLFWDEPEANVSPVYIPILVDILLELQRSGVQIFIATHNYFVANYVEVRKKESDEVSFLSLYRDNPDEGVRCERNESFKGLEHNPIMETFMELYHEEVRKAME